MVLQVSRPANSQAWTIIGNSGHWQTGHNRVFVDSKWHTDTIKQGCQTTSATAWPLAVGSKSAYAPTVRLRFACLPCTPKKSHRYETIEPVSSLSSSPNDDPGD